MIAAKHMRELLRADLKAAMQGRRRDDLSLLRTLIAAIDNAEAVPVADGAKPADSATFASGGAEAARRVLSEQDVADILDGEVMSRRAAAAQFRAGGAEAEATRLEDEAVRVCAYRDRLA